MQTQFHLLAHVMSQMRRVHAGFLSDTRHGQMVTSTLVLSGSNQSDHMTDRALGPYDVLMGPYNFLLQF